MTEAEPSKLANSNFGSFFGQLQLGRGWFSTIAKSKYKDFPASKLNQTGTMLSRLLDCPTELAGLKLHSANPFKDFFKTFYLIFFVIFQFK